MTAVIGGHVAAGFIRWLGVSRVVLDSLSNCWFGGILGKKNAAIPIGDRGVFLAAAHYIGCALTACISYCPIDERGATGWLSLEIVTSTRRFMARPEELELSATGYSLP